VKLARILGGVGRVMITAGTLILLFVAYQLWGTGIHTARAQDNLESTFEEEADDHPDPRPADGPRPRQEVPARPPAGELAGRIQIPAIGVDEYFLEGTTLDILQDGPGHYVETPMPGQPGNAAIAGHRTTYGQPFHNIDKIGDGDRIVITYTNGSRFVYRYLNTVIVDPTEGLSVLEDKFDNRLTLTSCHPKYSAAERIIVSAELVDRPARATPLPDAEDLTLDGESLDGQEHPRSPAIAWGVAAAMVWLAAWVVGRTWRRWPAYLLGLPIFLVVLYGFFENFSYFLPASY
jgi:sortase A